MKEGEGREGKREGRRGSRQLINLQADFTSQEVDDAMVNFNFNYEVIPKSTSLNTKSKINNVLN